MNKKTIGIILLVVVVGAIYFGYQKGLFGGIIGNSIGGIRTDSLMGAMKKQGQIVPSKSDFIVKCKKSSSAEQDECYGIGAFYYRDASFCSYLKDSKTKSDCTQENIEKMYAAQEEMQKAYAGGGVIPGLGNLPSSLPNSNGTDVPEGGVVPDQKPEANTGSTDIYGSTKEITVPSGIVSELKSILGEVCGGVKLTTYNRDFPVQGANMLIYVWKNKPTAEQLDSAFKKNGYTSDGPGEILFLQKGNVLVTIDWFYQMEDQEIVVTLGTEE